ncbi:MAG: hypothetical protein JWP96_999 [Polaromonas sp.]|nr:hypothetical protein [Polaromonas sp.]
MHPEFPPPIARRIVPWPALGLLAALVLLVHALVLGTHPARFGPAPQAASQRTPAFVTRSIPALPPVESGPPAVAAAPPVAPKPQPAAKPVKKPILKQKVPVAQAVTAQPAPDSIAYPVQPALAADPLPAPADPDSAASQPTADSTPPENSADTAPAAAPAASSALAAATPPQPPGQTPVTAMALPASARLSYQMTGSAKGLAYQAKGELAWENSGASYNARMTVKALFLGSRTLSSTGQLSDQGLAPSRFTDKSRSEVAAHFETAKGQISFSANTPTLPWVQGAQDRVSVFLQLGGMLAGNPAGFPVGATISTLTVGPRDADNWTFVVEGQEQLSLPFGDLATVKLSRQPRREFDQKLEVWYAPALGYLPVRNKITQANGDFVDQQLSELIRP